MLGIEVVFFDVLETHALVHELSVRKPRVLLLESLANLLLPVPDLPALLTAMWKIGELTSPKHSSAFEMGREDTLRALQYFGLSQPHRICTQRKA